ncbi:MAG: hypothetical protein QOK22_1851, partial [Gaiellaceae bacterium]|nr:hypothetical protein [Gaiellaceae bacterium]
LHVPRLRDEHGLLVAVACLTALVEGPREGPFVFHQRFGVAPG